MAGLVSMAGPVNMAGERERELQTCVGALYSRSRGILYSGYHSNSQ